MAQQGKAKVWRVFQEKKLLEFLQEKLAVSSLRSLKKELERNCCRINGTVERFGSRRVFPSDEVEYVASPPIKQNSLKVLFEHEDFLVVDKPPFFCSSLQALTPFFPDVFLTHRLDRDTTGCWILAKKKKAARQLQLLFAKKKIKKTYFCMVEGCLQQKRGKIETYLGKVGYFSGQSLYATVNHAQKGRLAVTYWELLQIEKNASLLKIIPITGRTHQIRVHMKELGCPIVGDRQYGQENKIWAARSLLHSARVNFCYRGRHFDIYSPFPEDFFLCCPQATLKQYEKNCL